MYKIIYPTYDATIYERWPDKNTGTDQIIELSKWATGQPIRAGDDTEYWDYSYVSRILMKFDTTQISQSISSGRIGSNAIYYLRLFATELTEIPISYSIYAYPISESWVNGTGYFNNQPEITNGVSWYYRNSKASLTTWQTSSYAITSTGSWSVNAGGGTWYTSSVASQSYEYTEPDIRMDVTSLFRSWLSGSIANNGMILKFSDNSERDTSIMGSMKFFSRDTHTIFVPRLEIHWDDQDNSGISNWSESDGESILYLKNLREWYNENEIAKIRIGMRDRYPTYTYATSSNYLSSIKRLPTSSYFQVQDYRTDAILIPFDVGTKINCDSNGNYVKLDCYSLMPERYYKLVFKALHSDNTIQYIDDNFVFKITRN